MGPYSSRNALLRARHSLKCWSCHVLLATVYAARPHCHRNVLQPSSQGHWLAVADEHSYFCYSRIALRESSTFGSMLDCLHHLSGSWTQVLKSLSSLRRVNRWGGVLTPQQTQNSHASCCEMSWYANAFSCLECYLLPCSCVGSLHYWGLLTLTVETLQLWLCCVQNLLYVAYFSAVFTNCRDYF